MKIAIVVRKTRVVHLELHPIYGTASLPAVLGLMTLYKQGQSDIDDVNNKDIVTCSEWTLEISRALSLEYVQSHIKGFISFE